MEQVNNLYSGVGVHTSFASLGDTSVQGLSPGYLSHPSGTMWTARVPAVDCLLLAPREPKLKL